jgi:hypothetical protein
MSTGGDATQSTGTGDDDDRHRRWMIALGILVGGAIVGAGIALALSGGGGGNETAATTSTSTPTTTQARGGGSNPGGGSNLGGGGPTGPTPTIVSFTGTGDGTVDCHNGNQQTFSDHWQTTNAVRVAITEGGSNLPPSGDGSLPFNCLTAPHTYTLTAFGSGGKTASKSITLTAVNVQTPSTFSGGNPPTSTT